MTKSQSHLFLVLIEKACLWLEMIFFIVFVVEETFTNITGNKLLSYLSHLNYNLLIQSKVLTLQRANSSFIFK